MKEMWARMVKHDQLEREKIALQQFVPCACGEFVFDRLMYLNRALEEETRGVRHNVRACERRGPE